MGSKSTRFQTWLYTGGNFDQLMGVLGVLNRSAPEALVKGARFNGDIGGLNVEMDANGKWRVLDTRDDNNEPPTKAQLEQLGVVVSKLA